MVDQDILATLNEYFMLGGGTNTVGHGVEQFDSTNVTFNNGSIVYVGAYRIKMVKESPTIPVKFELVCGAFSTSQITQLTSLKGCPERIRGTFQCNHTDISNLIGGPKYVENFYGCSGISHGRGLMSLDGLPESVDGIMYIDINNYAPALKLIPLKCTSIYIDRNEILQDTINNYRTFLQAGMPLKKVLWKCQQELVASGFEGNAKW
jgi:hypothetical protein